MLNMCNSVADDPLCALKICVFKPVSVTQGIAESSRVKIMWRKAVIIHTR